jgi:hypothetical protein|tara:strand:+ start:28 stop:165 length:138 start_codon:yes stop_codon:yes gene_type:complete
MPEEHPPDLGRCLETESSLPQFAVLIEDFNKFIGAEVSAYCSIIN